MFSFLKDILGVPRLVQIVGYEDPEVVIKAEKPLDIGVVDVLAEIGEVKIKAQIQIVESGEDLCRGLWVAPAEALPFLIEVFSHNEARINPRFPRRLRVRSSQLVGYQGNSVDLSYSGMRLLGKGLFRLDDTLDLVFELDDRIGTEIVCKAKVCWLAPSDKDDWIAIGVKYIDLNETAQPSQFALYRQFLERIGSAETVI